MKHVVVILVLIAFSINIHAQEGPVAEASRVMDEFGAAFTAGDFDVAAEILHYPHIRIARNVRVWNTPEDYKADRGPAFMERFRKSKGWHHSVLDRREVVQSSDTKVRFAVSFTRYRQDASVIATFDSLYIVLSEMGAGESRHARASPRNRLSNSC